MASFFITIRNNASHATALRMPAPFRKMWVVMIRRKAALWGTFVTVVGAIGWTAYALKYRPTLLHTPGDWDCACGEIYIKTTMRVIWNPFRDRQPEIVAADFLSRLKSNRCAVDDAVCRTALPSHRVSAWRLSYREDVGGEANLYYKLKKYGDDTPFGPRVGVIDLRKTAAGWRVVGFDSYF